MNGTSGACTVISSSIKRIYTRGKDESLDEAKTAAQKIIDEDGVIDEEITVQAPDVPFIRFCVIHPEHINICVRATLHHICIPLRRPDDEFSSALFVGIVQNIQQHIRYIRKCVAYDSLYDLQRSQDNKFYSAGTGTKSIMTGAFDEWGIPTKGYSGPNVSHEKMKYSSSCASDMLLDVLDDAYKKGGGKFIIRAAEGYADVVGRVARTRDCYVVPGG